MTQTEAAVTEFAPAKINLTLHVTGRRADGYHLLDSLVVFADIGDQISIAPAPRLSLGMEGPEVGELSAEADNLVLRAARLMGFDRGRITLTKRLPVASGIGGGSADAAATLRAIARLTGQPLPEEEDVVRLGADVPVCLRATPCRMSGIGALLQPVPKLPPMDIMLINPRVPVSTADIFRDMPSRDNPPMPPALPVWPDAVALADWLAAHRNDLAETAMRLTPAIADVLRALRDTPALFSGMSGSGATCFGLFPPGQAELVAARLSRAYPQWWCQSGRVL